MTLTTSRTILIAVCIFLGAVPVFAGEPQIVGDRLVYTDQNSIVDCSGLTQKQLLLAIFLNHQLNSLQVSEKTFSMSDMGRILAKGNVVKNIDKVPVDLDFSHWPKVDAAAFDAHARIWIGDKVSLNPRKTLADILRRVKSGELDLKHIPSREEIDTAVWKAYFDFVPEFPPEKTMQIALEKLEAIGAQKTAIDLGCGTGRDTRLMLSKGWTVLAIDSEGRALEKLRSSTREMTSGKLVTQERHFREINLDELPGEVSLINSSYTLPYSGTDFPRLWKKLAQKLMRGGLFAGQFFGKKDDLNGKVGVRTQTRAEILKLLKNFEVIHLEERQWDGKRVDGTPKHWHVFDVVARKKY